MSLTEKAVDDTPKDTEKNLLTALVKRIQPTARERTAKSLLSSFSLLFANQFHTAARPLVGAEHRRCVGSPH